MTLIVKSRATRLLMPDSKPGQKTLPLPPEEPAPVARRVPALTIVSHPVMARAGERVLLAGPRVKLSRESPDFSRRGSHVQRPLDDPYLTRTPLELTPGKDGGVQLSLGEHNTPVSVFGRKVAGVEELTREQMARGVPIVLCRRIVLFLHLVEERAQWPESDCGMVGESDAIHKIREQVCGVAGSSSSVLIRGETGTGKELVAHALHQASRRTGRYLAQNLGAIPEALAAAELFGANKGAFTDLKVDRKGLFREAHKGTLFLDEVGDAPPQVQVSLLRVLEAKEVTPLGTDEPVAVDVRLITATDIDIDALVKAKEFRDQLLHRLGYPICIPPLRERPEDVGLLFAHFARQELAALGEPPRIDAQADGAVPWLPASLAELLVGYRWPGNVRELRNVVQQLVIDNRGRATLAAGDGLIAKLKSSQGPAPEQETEERVEYSREQVREAYAACHFEITAAAERLGLKRPTFENWLKRYGIRRAVDLKPDEIRQAFQECGGSLEKMSKRLEVSRFALRSPVRTLGLDPVD
jgi:two-component system, NtrC family, nitrogen regulation response regulator GlnG